jgi:predicted small lipoprotein YifL
MKMTKLFNFKYFILILILLTFVGCGKKSSPSNGTPANVSTTRSTKNLVLSWDAPTKRIDGTSIIDSDIGGYKIHYGKESGIYSDMIDVGKVLTYSIPNTTFSVGNTYFAVTVYGTNGAESNYSNEVIKNIE